jgi:hypothetical protein
MKTKLTPKPGDIVYIIVNDKPVEAEIEAVTGDHVVLLWTHRHGCGTHTIRKDVCPVSDLRLPPPKKRGGK